MIAKALRGLDMRRLTVCWVCAVLGMSPARSEDRPTLFKNVSLVVYQLMSEAEGRCAINSEAWNTAIDFVANQSTKLKLIRKQEHLERSQELFDKAKEAVGPKLMAARTDAEKAAARKAWDEVTEKNMKYMGAPLLVLYIADALERNGSCLGHLKATVYAMLEPSKMLATGKLDDHPYEEIWGRGQLQAAAPDRFSRLVIQSSEEMMKSFVNDWAKAQREYSD